MQLVCGRSHAVSLHPWMPTPCIMAELLDAHASAPFHSSNHSLEHHHSHVLSISRDVRVHERELLQCSDDFYLILSKGDASRGGGASTFNKISVNSAYIQKW